MNSLLFRLLISTAAPSETIHDYHLKSFAIPSRGVGPIAPLSLAKETSGTNISELSGVVATP